MRDKALNTAANVLQYKNRSKAALLKRLLEKEIEEPDALYAVNRLEELGLLDDRAYGQRLVENYQARGYGVAYIRRALKDKLLEPQLVDELLEDFEPREDKMARYIGSRMAGKSPDRAMIKKVSDGLYRRGFSWDEIRAAMDRYALTAEEEYLE